jgi:cell division protein FtsB
MRRSVTRFFGALVIPAVFGAAAAYFGYYAIWGTRGAVALTDVKARLAVKQEQLDAAQNQRQQLQHRIALLKPGSADPDLVQELARSQLQDGASGQVAVPRDR